MPDERSRTDKESQLRSDEHTSNERVWIFHGNSARFAAGVFRSLDEAMAWAAKHSVSGIVTEYPVGDGCYDIALADGYFTPKRSHHGTPEHVAAFSPGFTQHVHIKNGHLWEQVEGTDS